MSLLKSQSVLLLGLQKFSREYLSLILFPASLRSCPVELYAGLNAELYLIEQHNRQFLSSTPHYDNRDTFLHAANCRLEGVTREVGLRMRAETDFGWGSFVAAY